jgi:hypothetical protein
MVGEERSQAVALFTSALQSGTESRRTVESGYEKQCPTQTSGVYAQPDGFCHSLHYAKPTTDVEKGQTLFLPSQVAYAV